MAEGYRWRDTRVQEQCAWMVAHVLQPFSDSPITIDGLLGRDTASMTAENAALDELMGVAAVPDAHGYERVMAKIAARREEAHG